MDTPPLRYTVAIEGFSAFERGGLASYFRLAVGRDPAYQLVDAAGLADFRIADADQQAVLEQIAADGRERDTVFVGAQAPAGALAWVQRPIEPTRIVRELDNLVAVRRRAFGSRPEPSSAVAEAAAAIEDAAPPPDWREGRAGGGREVLVVDDSGIARKFLAQRLERLGYRVQAASSGELALELLKTRAFAIAFLDVVLGPPGAIDGLRLCQYIKQRSDPPLGMHPAVVLVTGLSGAMDKVRGSLAGCDAYLTKPLVDDELRVALRKLDPEFAIA